METNQYPSEGVVHCMKPSAADSGYRFKNQEKDQNLKWIATGTTNCLLLEITEFKAGHPSQPSKVTK